VTLATVKGEGEVAGGTGPRNGAQSPELLSAAAAARCSGSSCVSQQ
jgi:hypothetical protein